MNFPIVSIKTIEREVDKAIEQKLSLDEACPYSFHEPAGQEFKRAFQAKQQARHEGGEQQESTS